MAKRGALSSAFDSPEGIGLLSAGLGILANNTGNYGQFGPAFGRGALMGLETYLPLAQQKKDEARRKEAAAELARLAAMRMQQSMPNQTNGATAAMPQQQPASVPADISQVIRAQRSKFPGQTPDFNPMAQESTGMLASPGIAFPGIADVIQGRPQPSGRFEDLLQQQPPSPATMRQFGPDSLPDDMAAPTIAGMQDATPQVGVGMGRDPFAGHFKQGEAPMHEMPADPTERAWRRSKLLANIQTPVERGKLRAVDIGTPGKPVGALASGPSNEELDAGIANAGALKSNAQQQAIDIISQMERDGLAPQQPQGALLQRQPQQPQQVAAQPQSELEMLQALANYANATGDYSLFNNAVSTVLPGAQQLNKAAAVDPPKMRSITQGSKTVDQQFNPETRQWETVGEGPRWNPNAGGGGAAEEYGALLEAAGIKKGDPRYQQMMLDYATRRGSGVNVNVGDRAPSGYRWAGDGQSLEKIPGGPADKVPEAQQKQLIGTQNLRNAIQEYRDSLAGFSGGDWFSPNARALIQSKYQNMLLQAKEAYNLGVLNGPDFTILSSVITDPTSVSGGLMRKETLDKQASELARIMGTVGENASQGTTHGGAQKPGAEQRSTSGQKKALPYVMEGGKRFNYIGTSNGKPVYQSADGEQLIDE